jgi:hypothetical protein
LSLTWRRARCVRGMLWCRSCEHRQLIIDIAGVPAGNKVGRQDQPEGTLRLELGLLAHWSWWYRASTHLRMAVDWADERPGRVGLGLLGLSWADGEGMTGFPPQPPRNLDHAAVSIL